MRLIYRDNYDTIDRSMSDSQVGGRKKKNIRNHIWVINGIINDVLHTKKKAPMDIQIYGYKQCFDSMWLEECMHDIWDAGLKDNAFALLYNANSLVNIKVKTPVGKTEGGDITNVITQGDVFAPLLCSKQIDTIGQECLEEEKYTYKYKGEVDIPPLAMVDDLISVSECGYRTTMVNSYLKSKTNSKKLQFGTSKCKKIHVGKYCEQFKCQELSVDSWEEIEVKDKLEDCWMGEEPIEEANEEKYIGDIIDKDGKNIKNIKARVDKGKGIVTRIMMMLEGIPFGKYYFEVACILRNTLLVSSLLCNSEAWYNLTNSEVKLLESVDLMLLRKILNAPKSSPKEILYLELGCIPLKFIIQKRRLSFLHYILQEDPNSLIYRFFESQSKNNNQKDWTKTVTEDLIKLDLKLNYEEITNMKKSKFKNLVKNQVEVKALIFLNQLKSEHSKVRKLDYKMIKMRKYLMPNNEDVTNEEKQLLFKLRCRLTETKTNFKGLYDNYMCDLCDQEEETQEHLFRCTEILKRKVEIERNDYEKIFNGTIHDQILMTRIFRENMKIRDEILKDRQ